MFSEMYEISPYATFSVPGRENRSVTTATLDYTMQFKTFGHLENEDINTIDYDRSTVDFERYFLRLTNSSLRAFEEIEEIEEILDTARRGSARRGAAPSTWDFDIMYGETPSVARFTDPLLYFIKASDDYSFIYLLLQHPLIYSLIYLLIPSSLRLIYSFIRRIILSGDLLLH